MAVKSKAITDIVILAAGKGSRMNSDIPKVLHLLSGEPLLSHVMRSADSVENARKIVVVGHGEKQIKQHYESSPLTTETLFVTQSQQLGTGHAVKAAMPHIRDSSRVLILYGDVPLITPETITGMFEVLAGNSLVILTADVQDPDGYGRIVRDKEGNIECIVEQKDASMEQSKIREINTGVLAIESQPLKEWLPKIGNKNAKAEFYLTDLIGLARREGFRVRSANPNSIGEIKGINDRVQLAELERQHQRNLAEKLLLSGTGLADPSRIDLRGELVTGRDNFIDINCVFEGNVVLGDGTRVGPGCIIRDSQIGDNVNILANSVIEQSKIGEGVVVGPFARLRAGTELAANSKVGNFVETKKAKVGKGSKINHLSYVGDAELAGNVNIGAGTITCNYDGHNKHTTRIGENVFVGSNSTLVAPIKLEDGSFVAAGSTVSKSVNEKQLAVGRAKQRNISGWVSPAAKAKEE